MSKDIIITAEERVEVGTNACRALRRKGRVPANLNRVDGTTSMLALSEHDFEQMLRQHTSESLIADMQIGEAVPVKVLVRHIQHGPLRGDIQHVDFLEVAADTVVRVTIPVEVEGVPVGVSLAGGTLEQTLREIEVECVPGDLVECFIADVSSLQIGDTFFVSDLVMDARFTLLTAGEIGIASVHAQRTAEDGAAAETDEDEKEGDDTAKSKRAKED